MRRPLAKIRYETLLALGFIAQLKDLLFPEKLHGEGVGNEVREILGVRTFEVFRIVVEDERVASFKKLDELALDAGIQAGVAVFEVVDVAFEERILLEKLDDAKGSAADSDNVYAAVVVALDDVADFRGAADAGDALGKSEEHAEFGFFLEAVFDHLAVARLENVQGEFCAGKKDDVQRKERNAFRAHGSQSLIIPDRANGGVESLRSGSV